MALESWGGEAIGMTTATVSGSQAVYAISLPSAGYYLVYAVDSLDETPPAGSWVGGHGWEGTASVEAAGDTEALRSELSTMVVSVEAPTSSADFTMR